MDRDRIQRSVDSGKQVDSPDTGPARARSSREQALASCAALEKVRPQREAARHRLNERGRTRFPTAHSPPYYRNKLWDGPQDSRQPSRYTANARNLERHVGFHRVMSADDPYEYIPDARDGLTRKERIILYCLHEAQKEFGERSVPTFTLYGRVVEKIDIGQEEFQHILNRLVGLTRNSDGSSSFG